MADVTAQHDDMTPGGRPRPLTGRSLATHSVVVKQPGVALREYPEVAVPAQEELAPDEMRLICIGSGNPPIRRGQAATGWLVQLGNGDNFIFDAGGGVVGNLWSLEIHPAYLDKLFLTHLHLDHVGGVLPLFDAMGWARNTPLHIWGASGATPELGTAAFCRNLEAASLWHTTSKKGLVPSGGMSIVAHEFDYGQLSAENPRILVYDESDVRIYAFPVAHIIVGAVAYRLEWKGLSMTFHGDGEPCAFEAEQAQGVDVFMHEAFLDAETFSAKNNIPLPIARNVAGAHSTPDRLGRLFDIAKPILGVAYHYFQGDDTIDPFFDNLAKTYDGPVALAQDLTVINVTPEQIVVREAQTDRLHWTPPGPDAEPGPLDPMSPGVTPAFVTDTILPPEE